jgi:hypothetical protein
MFKILAIFRRNRGHCLVPENPRPGSLRQWVAQQQAAYRSGNLSAKRIHRLEQIGFAFDVVSRKRGGQEDYEARWEKCLQELIEFKATQGHCEVPFRRPQNPRLTVSITL